MVGTLAMARTSDPQSATAQFFINISNAFLDPVRISTRRSGTPLNTRAKSIKTHHAPIFWVPAAGYTVFGKVV